MSDIDHIAIAENAMCLWEVYLEQEDDLPHIKALRERIGTSALRLQFISLAEPVEAAWEAAQERGYDDSFDWEFCPWFLKVCSRVEGDSLTCIDNAAQFARRLADAMAPPETDPENIYGSATMRQSIEEDRR